MAATAVSSNHAAFPESPGILPSMACRPRLLAFLIGRQGTMDRPTLIGPDAFHRPAAETPGVDRREAFADDHVWAGRSRTQAGTWSGWHVHPGHDTYVSAPRRWRSSTGHGLLTAVLVDLLLQRCPGGVEPLQVAEDRRQGRGQAVAADPGDGRLDGFQSTVQLGDLAAPLALGAGLERRQ